MINPTPFSLADLNLEQEISIVPMYFHKQEVLMSKDVVLHSKRLPYTLPYSVKYQYNTEAFNRFIGDFADCYWPLGAKPSMITYEYLADRHYCMMHITDEAEQFIRGLHLHPRFSLLASKLVLWRSMGMHSIMICWEKR